jgi:50S ribosomal protein L16 3-hydroxylase
LDYVHEHLDLPGQYADPDLVPAREPARIGSDMQHKIASMLSDVRWTRRDVVRFIGVWLTEPKATVFFDVPARRLSRAAFIRAAKRAGLSLDARSQMLFDDERVFVNGESVDRGSHESTIIELANARKLSASHVAAASAHELALLHDWHCHGYLHLETKRA